MMLNGFMVRSCSLPLLAIAMLQVRPGRAQEPFQPSPAAEALFQEGKALVAEGRVAEACVKFEASVRIERAVGALLNLADCHERIGRTASAWSEYSDAASEAERASDPVRARFAHRRAADLQSSLSRIVLTLSGIAPGMTIRINGSPLASDAWSSSVPVDPGRLIVQASAVGFRDWTGTVDVRPRETVPVRIPALRSLPPRKTTSSPPAGSPDRTAFYVAAGAGAAAIAFGAAFGLKTIATQAKVDQRCGDRYCDATGLEWEHDARTYATLSTIGFGAGAALGGLAAWLYFSKPSPSGATVAVSVDPTGVRLRGAF